MIKDDNINCTVEALILASPEPVSAKKLGEVLDNLPPARIRQAVEDLNNLYLGCGNSFRIRELAGGYQFHILPDFEQPIKRMLSRERTVRLSRAALEVMAIVAYKQPVTKTEIEHIRGVASDGVIHNLLQRKLILLAGRSEAAGRPLLYKTSAEFLKFFGLNRLSDLPRMEEIEEMIRQAEPSRDQTVLPLGMDDNATGPIDETIDDDDLDGGNGHEPDHAIVLTPIGEGTDMAESLEEPDTLSGNNAAADPVEFPNDDWDEGQADLAFDDFDDDAETEGEEDLPEKTVDTSAGETQKETLDNEETVNAGTDQPSAAVHFSPDLESESDPEPEVINAAFDRDPESLLPYDPSGSGNGDNPAEFSPSETTGTPGHGSEEDQH